MIDEEEHSKVEMEWEQEAWDNYVREDLERTLEEDTKEWFHAVTFDDDTLFVYWYKFHLFSRLTSMTAICQKNVSLGWLFDATLTIRSSSVNHQSGL